MGFEVSPDGTRIAFSPLGTSGDGFSLFWTRRKCQGPRPLAAVFARSG